MPARAGGLDCFDRAEVERVDHLGTELGQHSDRRDADGQRAGKGTEADDRHEVDRQQDFRKGARRGGDQLDDSGQLREQHSGAEQRQRQGKHRRNDGADPGDLDRFDNRRQHSIPAIGHVHRPEEAQHAGHAAGHFEHLLGREIDREQRAEE